MVNDCLNVAINQVNIVFICSLCDGMVGKYENSKIGSIFIFCYFFGFHNRIANNTNWTLNYEYRLSGNINNNIDGTGGSFTGELCK